MSQSTHWVGVPVKLLLDRASVQPRAVQSECLGGDADHTTRGVEIEKLMDDPILTYAMNGQLITTIDPRRAGGTITRAYKRWQRGRADMYKG